MGKSKKQDKIPNWHIVLYAAAIIVPLSSIVTIAASARGWSAKETIVDHLIPVLIVCAIFATFMGYMLVWCEKREKRLSKKC